MKKLIIITGFIVMAGIAMTGCYSDVIMPEKPTDPNGPPQAVSYKNELSPMFESKCALSGCHVSGAHHPYMTSDVSYYEIVNGGYVNTTVPDQSILMIMLRGEMGQYMPASADQQKVYDWIRNGAPNN
jgi:hypothetical protein